MGMPTGKHYLVRTTRSSLALFILTNIMIKRAAVDELSSAAAKAVADDTVGAGAVQALQLGFARQSELLTMQGKQLERQEQQIREQREQLQIASKYIFLSPRPSPK